MRNHLCSLYCLFRHRRKLLEKNIMAHTIYYRRHLFALLLLSSTLSVHAEIAIEAVIEAKQSSKK